MKDPYAGFASIYDQWQKQFHPPYWRYALQRTRSLFAQWESALDLACGTGAWSVPVARAGIRVYAVDGSAAMLAELRRKRGRLPIEIIRSPLHRFRLHELVDGAVCFFDSLNHLTKPQHFYAALRCVFRQLKPGGWFVFDLNNEHSFRDLWRGQFITHTPQFTVNITSNYDEESGVAKSEVVIFRATQAARHTARNGQFVKTRTVVQERFYPDHEVRRALEAAGFIRIAKEDISPFTDLSAAPLKTWWRCMKPESS
jgi:SAM-dependent methyltransferase